MKGDPFGGMDPGVHFVFRDPFDVFRDFFGGRDPFEELLDREYFLKMMLCANHYFLDNFTQLSVS